MTHHSNDHAHEHLQRVNEQLRQAQLAGDYHRTITVTLLLPDDDCERNAEIVQLSAGRKLGKSQVLAVQDGHVILEHQVLKEMNHNDTDWKAAMQYLVGNHNTALWEAVNAAHDQDMQVTNKANEREGLTPLNGFYRFAPAVMAILALVAFMRFG